MANYTPQQLQQMNSMLAGTFDRLDTAPKSQPGYTMDQIYGGILPSASPAYSNSRWGAGAISVNAPGTADGSVLLGKDQATFAGDNPKQVGAPTLNKPYSNPGWGATQPQAKTPVNLTVTGKGTPYNNPGWGAGTLAALMGQQGADPGMQGLTGNMQMASGIPAQLPPADGSVALPKWSGPAVAAPSTTVKGSSTGKPYNIGQTYSSGGYMFEMTPNGPKQIGRDPKGVIPQTYQGTPQAAASAQRREALTAGTQPQQNAIQSMGDIGWLMKQLGNTAPKVGQAYGAGGNDYTYTANGFQPTPKTGK